MITFTTSPDIPKCTSSMSVRGEVAMHPDKVVSKYCRMAQNELLLMNVLATMAVHNGLGAISSYISKNPLIASSSLFFAFGSATLAREAWIRSQRATRIYSHVIDQSIEQLLSRGFQSKKHKISPFEFL